eukprot:jgi/Ulvmu1/12707/UM095_0011.1
MRIRPAFGLQSVLLMMRGSAQQWRGEHVGMRTNSPLARLRLRNYCRQGRRKIFLQQLQSCGNDVGVATVQSGCGSAPESGCCGSQGLQQHEQQHDRNQDHQHNHDHKDHDHNDHKEHHQHHGTLHQEDHLQLGCCSGHKGQGHEHSHYERDVSWGWVRRFLFDSVSRLGIFKFSDVVSHSTFAAAGSAVLLVASCAIVSICSGCVLGQWKTLASAAATATMASSLALSATPAFADAFYKALQAQVDAHTLMAFAGAGSFALGFPLEGALLFCLFHVAHVLEGVFVDNAQRNLSGLVDALPKTVRTVSTKSDGVIDWASQESLSVKHVGVGRLIVVKPGELVPLDGIVHTGTSLLGQESITGESMPVLKRPGSTVFSGGQVHDGTLVIRTTTLASDSLTARIARITATAMRNKAAVQSFLTRITRRWSQALIAAAVLALVTLVATGVPLLGKHGALYRALALLTAGAPCALVLVPLAFVCAVATLSRHGIVVKGSSVLDALAGVSFVALDKTGTLSEGRLQFISAIPVQEGPATTSEGDALAIAAALSLQGTHPVCDAVLDAYGGSWSVRNLPSVSSFRLAPGAGMSGEAAGRRCLFGSEEYVTESLNAAQLKALQRAVQQHGQAQVVSVLVVFQAASSGITHAAAQISSVHVFMFSDVPKKDSSDGMDLIRKLCKGVGMYTGDNEASAARLGELVGLGEGEVHAGLTPSGKSDRIAALQADGQRVLMVGDGLNDAPALATADVSAVFTETVDTTVAGVADIVVLREGSAGARGGDVNRIAFLLKMARSARANIIQNLGIALVSMAAAVVPSLLGVLPLWVAVLVHEGSTVLVALNSCRLLFVRPQTA